MPGKWLNLLLFFCCFMAIVFDTLWLLFTVCYPTEIDDLWCVLMISLLLYVNCHFPVFKLPLAIGLLTSKTWNFVQGIWDFWGVKENIRWTPSFWGSNLGRLWFSVTRIRMVFPMKADQFLGWTCGGGGIPHLPTYKEANRNFAEDR